MKKLTLNKETILSLNPAETQQVDGAILHLTLATCQSICFRTVIGCTLVCSYGPICNNTSNLPAHCN